MSAAVEEMKMIGEAIGRAKHSTTMRRWILAAFLMVTLSAGVRFAGAQATATASRDLSFGVFGAYSRVNPDYGANGNGYMFGGEVKRHRRLFDPAIEFRYGHFRQTVKEDYYMGNIKLERSFGPGARFTPYIDGGMGWGSIQFPGGYNDSSILKNVGGGVDVALFHNLGVQGDYQYQFWNTGGFHGVTLTPSLMSGGLFYNFAGIHLIHRRN